MSSAAARMSGLAAPVGAGSTPAEVRSCFSWNMENAGLFGAGARPPFLFLHVQSTALGQRGARRRARAGEIISGISSIEHLFVIASRAYPSMRPRHTRARRARHERSEPRCAAATRTRPTAPLAQLDSRTTVAAAVSLGLGEVLAPAAYPRVLVDAPKMATGRGGCAPRFGEHARRP